MEEGPNVRGGVGLMAERQALKAKGEDGHCRSRSSRKVQPHHRFVVTFVLKIDCPTD